MGKNRTICEQDDVVEQVVRLRRRLHSDGRNAGSFVHHSVSAWTASVAVQIAGTLFCPNPYIVQQEVLPHIHAKSHKHRSLDSDSVTQHPGRAPAAD